VRLPLDEIASRIEAEALQTRAVQALGRYRCGYKIGATSPEAQRLLQSPEPFFAPIFAEDILESGAEYPRPAGLLGIECEFAFVIARAYPEPGETIERRTLAAAIADCCCALEIVGRRVEPGVALNEKSSIADFALNIALVRGAPVPDWRETDLNAMEVHAAVDGEVVASGSARAVLGHPLEALAWLARALAERDERLEAGDLVSTGTCTGIVPLAAGQAFEGRFGALPPLRLRLT
jgi:2-keto-4-pentenoate hydratase